MAVEYNRQYVGARYVPQFFNNPDGSWDWAQGFQYEPLTMVKYGNNTYTSKQLVPANVGAPNINNDYWAQTGDYNGYLSYIDVEINKINNRLVNYNEKNVILLSDSYGMVNPKGYNWIDYLPPLIKADSAYTYGLNGGSFSNKNSQYTFLNALKTEIVPLIENKEKITHIIVGGGFNDASLIVSKESTITDIVDSIREFYIYVTNTFPNCKLYLTFLAWETEILKIQRQNGKALFDTYNAYLYTYGYKGYYLSGPEYSLHFNNYLDDSGFHPNVSGSQFIAQNIANALETGYATVNYNSKINVNSNFQTENLEIYFELSNEISRLYNKGELTIKNITLTEGMRTDILTLVNSTLLDNYNQSANVLVKYGNNYGIANIFLYGNVLYIIPTITGVSLDLTIYGLKLEWYSMLSDRDEL